MLIGNTRGSMRPKEKHKDHSAEKLEIVLWGHSGAGKDYLVRGFYREAWNIDQSEDHIYSYAVKKADGEQIPGFDTVLMVNPTSLEEDIAFEYIRKLKSLEDRNDYRFNHYHRGLIHNNRGGLLVDVTLGVTRNASIETLFATQENIIVVLDLPDKKPEDMSSTDEKDLKEGIIEESPALNAVFQQQAEQKNSNQENGIGATRAESQGAMKAWTVEGYYENVHSFFEYLDKVARKQRKNIAICMTKADMTEFDGDPMDIIGRRYGTAFLNMIEAESQRHNIKVFHTTATGYRSDAEKTTNGDPIENPVNAAAPFFWFFEMEEKKRLKKKPFWLTFARLQRSNYIPYPAAKTPIREIKKKK